MIIPGVPRNPEDLHLHVARIGRVGNPGDCHVLVDETTSEEDKGFLRKYLTETGQAIPGVIEEEGKAAEDDDESTTSDLGLQTGGERFGTRVLVELIMRTLVKLVLQTLALSVVEANIRHSGVFAPVPSPQIRPCFSRIASLTGTLRHDHS